MQRHVSGKAAKSFFGAKFDFLLQVFPINQRYPLTQFWKKTLKLCYMLCKF